jgi:hypothetical protein
VDPVTIIVAVLVKALTGAVASGAQKVAQRAMMDAYDTLKGVLIRKYGSPIATSIQQLEQRPESAESQAAVTRALRAAGANQDPEIIQLASDLSRLIDNPELAEETYDPIESVQRRAGVRAIGDVLDRHMDTVISVRSNYRVDDSDLLTARIGRSSNVPQSVRAELTQLHANMRKIIERIAQMMEDQKYKDAEEAIADPRFGLSDRERATALIAADKKFHVSYQTLRTVVEFFSAFNQETLARIEREASPQRESNMMLGNAVMVYELTDFVISYIREFTVDGVGQIDSIYADVRKRIGDLRAEENALEQRAKDPAIESGIREQTLAHIEHRRGAIDEVEGEWAYYATEVKQVDGVLDEVRRKIPSLELLRDNAGAQISALQLVSLLSFLKQNSEAIKGTIDAIQGFQLAPLTSNRVRRLLNI